MNPTLNDVFNILFAGSLFCGMACLCVVIYASLRTFSVHSRLLGLVDVAAPPVFERLSDKAWRTGTNPWKLKVFLRSDELEEVLEVGRAKEDARRVQRLLVKATGAALTLWFFALAVGILAVALGSTDIRVSG